MCAYAHTNTHTYYIYIYECACVLYISSSGSWSETLGFMPRNELSVGADKLRKIAMWYLATRDLSVSLLYFIQKTL